MLSRALVSEVFRGHWRTICVIITNSDLALKLNYYHIKMCTAYLTAPGDIIFGMYIQKSVINHSK